ncbi:AI-2E family transporter [Demequina sp. NBRC 110052]|uniref:AI-2E family transporter n=1 Tax=Demequina sp. NBRC 110052 TaxID=1570341 RepID=UPI000A05AB02|nr:AI-2E family transporter [Demequina sp. NBRC 110052]
MADQETEAPRSHVHYTRGHDVVEDVPTWLRLSAAWAWRLIVVGIIVAALGSLFMQVSSLFIPVIIALFITAPLGTLVDRLERWHLPRGLGALVAILLLIIVVAGLMTLAGAEIAAGFDDLRVAALQGFNELVTWLAEGPLHVSADQLENARQTVMDYLQGNAAGLASGALSITGTVTGLIAGIAIALLTLFFFLRDGEGMWRWAVGLLPDRNVDSVDRAGRGAWLTLRRYTQTTVFVAFVDAVGIGLGAWILGVPLALPIGILVFLFSFIPLFGATISGIIAVLVALVDGGTVTALWMVGIVLLVQQIEGNVLYPWLFGKVASLHPLVILITVSVGTITLGLVGAVIAVPIVSFFVAFGRGLHAELSEPPPLTTGQLPVIAQRSKDALLRAKDRMTHTSQIRVRGRGSAQGSADDAPARGAEDSAGPEPTEGTIRVRRPREDEPRD